MINLELNLSINWIKYLKCIGFNESSEEAMNSYLEKVVNKVGSPEKMEELGLICGNQGI